MNLPFKINWPPQGRLWLPLLIGLVGLYGPSIYQLFHTIWAETEHMHGPIVLALSVWLMVRNIPAMIQQSSGPNAWGWFALLLGLVLYVVGRSQDIILFEMGSMIWLLGGLILLHYGWGGLRAQWFPLFFMFFMVPMPSNVVDTVTMPMKMAVSYVTEQVLYVVGYPIGRNGVILQIGQYMLLVADACAGLQTLLTLEALGLLYLNLVRRDSLVRNVGLGLLIVPISFTANVIRVISLSLITYHFGDAAGQGFLHGFAGIVLFLSALLLIIGFDTLLQHVEQRRLTARSARGEQA